MKAAKLREWHTANQAGLSPHEVHCHQYLAMLHAYHLTIRSTAEDGETKEGSGVRPAVLEIGSLSEVW